MTVLTFRLSHPPARLHPNHGVPASLCARRARAADIKRYRAYVCAVAMEAQGDARPLRWREATALLTFWFDRNSRRDRDNLLAWFKSGFDGLRDAGLIVDDSGLTHQPVAVVKDAALAGTLEVRIERA